MNIVYGIIRWCLAGVLCYEIYNGAHWALVAMIGFLFVGGEISTAIYNHAFRTTAQGLIHVDSKARRALSRR